MDFLEAIRYKNPELFYFGALCLLAALAFFAISFVIDTRVAGVNAWYKPIKFALSIGIYSWTMALFCSYLPSFNQQLFSWSIILLLGFEIVYIALQAARGELSHFNVSSPLYGFLYGLMGIAAALVALYTAYVGILFMKGSFPDLPQHYLWAIRIGIFIFVIFAFEGFLMGSRLSHTIGGPDGESSLWFVNWSTKYGDPRVAHFIGMHALQVLPLLTYYLLRSTRATIVLGLLYLLLALFTLVQALQGRPFVKI